MFFLRIAEALIANQEANRLPDYSELEQKSTSVRTSPPFSDHMDLHGEHDVPSYRHEDLPLIKGRKRADSMDGHILRSLISRRPEGSPKSSLSVSPVDQRTRPVPPPPRLLLPMTSCGQSSHSPPVSPENSNASCGTSGSSPSNARLGGSGGLLYNLLVSSDSRHPGTSHAAPSPSPPSRPTRSPSSVSASAPEMEVCEFTQRPSSSRLSQWPPPPSSSQASHHGPADEPLLPHYEDAGYPNPVKKYKATETYTTQSSRLLDSKHPILPICSNGRNDNSGVMMQPPTGLRRFTFGGYSAPRGEHIAGRWLQHPRSAIPGSMTLPNLIKPSSIGINNRDEMERSALGSLRQNSSFTSTESASAAATCPNKVLSAAVPSSSVSTPSILFALISSPCVEWSPGLSSTSTDSGLDEPLDLTGSALFNKLRPTPPPILHSSLNTKSTSTTTAAQQQASPLVQLAKKTARPVQARITEWLRQALEFVITSVSSLATVDGVESWLPLFRATWHCLLVISMAEHALEVVVVERTNHTAGGDDTTQPAPWGEKIVRWLLLSEGQSVSETADRAFADAVIQCLNDLRSAQLTPEEFCLLRSATIMAAEQPSVLPTMAMKLIRNARSPWSALSADPIHIEEQTEGTSDRSESAGLQKTRPAGSLANLQRALVSMVGISPQKMVSLFCTHLNGESSLRSILPPALFKHLSLINPPSPVQETVTTLREPALWSEEEQPHRRRSSDWTDAVQISSEMRNGSPHCKRDSILYSLIQNSPLPSSKLLTTAASVQFPKSNV